MGWAVRGAGRRGQVEVVEQGAVGGAQGEGAGQRGGGAVFGSVVAARGGRVVGDVVHEVVFGEGAEAVRGVAAAGEGGHFGRRCERKMKR